MAGIDWSKFATAGAKRPDTFSGMNPKFSGALSNLFAAAPPDIQSQLQVKSGYRSPEHQAELWQGALQKYGSPEAARKWVAPPGHSQHNMGNAADLGYLAPAALDYAHKNAAAYGLAFPLSNENWHVELAGARGQHGAAPTMANMQNKTFDPVGEVMGNNAASGVAQFFGSPPAADPAAPPTMMADASGMPGAAQSGGNMPLAMLFMQQQQDQKRRKEEEQAAEDAKRAALFGQAPIGYRV